MFHNDADGSKSWNALPLKQKNVINSPRCCSDVLTFCYGRNYPMWV